jgi:hypothetical protein
MKVAKTTTTAIVKPVVIKLNVFAQNSYFESVGLDLPLEFDLKDLGGVKYFELLKPDFII